MIKISVDELSAIYKNISEFRGFLSQTPAAERRYEEQEIFFIVDDALCELHSKMSAHGSVAFFTKKDHEILLDKNITDLLEKITGWL